MGKRETRTRIYDYSWESWIMETGIDEDEDAWLEQELRTHGNINEEDKNKVNEEDGVNKRERRHKKGKGVNRGESAVSMS